MSFPKSLKLKKIPFLFLASAVCALAFGRHTENAELYVIVVDTSGSMLEKVSATDERIRLHIVQEALSRYLLALPLNSKLRLISFNKGIVSDKSFTLKDDDSYRTIVPWVQNLAEEAKTGTHTHLWSALDYALKIATQHAENNPGETAYVRVLTDGLDTEKTTSFDDVISKYPLVDSGSIRGNIVILGDIELSVVSRPFFEITRSPDFADIFPPVIQWNPRLVRVRVPVSFFDNSETTYSSYDWSINGQSIGTQKAPTFLFKEAGRYSISLRATTTNNKEVTASQLLEVLPSDLTAEFIEPTASVIQGREVTFLARPEGSVQSYSWSINGTLVSDSRDLRTRFDAVGPVEITLTTRDVFGNEATNTRVIEVRPPAPLPQVKISADRISGPAPLTSKLSVSSTAPIKSVLWDFGNGMTSGSPDTEFTWTEDGQFPVSVTVTFLDESIAPVIATQTFQVGDELPWWVWVLLAAAALFLLGVIFRGREPRIDGIVRARKEINLTDYSAKSELSVPLDAFGLNAAGNMHIRFIGSYKRPVAKACLTGEVAKIGSRRYRPGEYFDLHKQTRIILSNGEMLEYNNPRLRN